MRERGAPRSADRMRNLTTRLVILLMLALMIITGIYDYVRLGRERERLVEQTREDERIFAETLALGADDGRAEGASGRHLGAAGPGRGGHLCP